MEEIWKTFDGYQGRYQISNLGRVRSVYANGKVRYLIPDYSAKYGRVTFSENYTPKKYEVSRLVCLLFNGEPTEDKNEVDHINTDVTDNRACNLRWTSHKENCNNPITKSRHKENNNYWLGKKFSEEHRKKISEALKKSKNKTS